MNILKKLIEINESLDKGPWEESSGTTVRNVYADFVCRIDCGPDDETRTKLVELRNLLPYVIFQLNTAIAVVDKARDYRDGKDDTSLNPLWTSLAHYEEYFK